MNAQNLPTKAATSTEIPAKRRRGRPRKDDNVVKRVRPQVPITPAAPSDIARNIQQQVTMVNPNIARVAHNNSIQVGQMVSGVVEGTFDAGYFIAVRVGQSSTILRGLVFQPGCIVPVTPANDIAPHVKMYQRAEFRLPVPNMQHPASSSAHQPVQHAKRPAQLVDHSVAPMVPNQVLAFGPPHFRPPLVNVPPAVLQQRKEVRNSLQGQIAAQKNLRMVEQDDVMQVFEVTKTPDVSNVDSGAAKNANEAASHGSQAQKPAMESGIGPSKLVGDQVKSPDHGSQKALLVTVSQSLYPDLQHSEAGMKPGGALVQKDVNCTNVGPHHALTLCEPQSEPVHQEITKSRNHGPEEARLDGSTPHSVDCRPEPEELIQHEPNSVHLELAAPMEGTSVPSLHAAMDNPVEESVVNFPAKDGACYSENPVPDISADGNVNGSAYKPEFAVKESGFQENVDQPQASTSSADQSPNMEFVMEDLAAQPTNCPASNVTENGN